MTRAGSWKVADDPNRQIGSLNTQGFEDIADAVAGLFAKGDVGYSGVILSNDEAVTTGQTVEKNCYNKGGFRFLYKSYDENARVEGFPTSRLVSVLNHICTGYLREVEDQGDAEAELDLAWAVCQREGDYGTMHNHVPPYGNPDGRYSGMFYLKTPACISPVSFPNGCLHIVVDNKAHFSPPIPGSIVIWPSWMMHGIHPFRGDGDRLGVAFDFITK